MTDVPPPDEARRRPPRVRANALDAAAFVRLLEVDPRVVEALLDVLEDAGVAAYAEPPVTGSSYTEHVRPPRRRHALEEVVWVDRDRRESAAELVAAELPGLLAELGRTAEDEAFEKIVAGWDTEPDAAAVAPWPVPEDIDVTTRSPDDPSLDRDQHRLYPDGPDFLDTLEAGDAAAAMEHDEEHFVPPPPPPIPRASQRTKFAIAGLALGAALLFGLHRLIGYDAGSGSRYLGVVLIVASVATLVAGMRDAPPDDAPDDGAVV